MAAKKQDSKSAKVRELLSLGAPASDIAKQVGCTRALVYNVKARMGGGGKRKPGRPAKASGAAQGTSDIEAILDSVRRSHEEHENLRGTMQRVIALIEAAL